QRRRGPAEREVEEALRPPVRVPADDEERLVVAEPEERVECHHESALGRVAAPALRDCLELRPQAGIELAGTQDLRVITGALEPVHRLPHLADRPALERERRRVDHRLVAVVEGVQPVLAVDAERALRDAEHSDAPSSASLAPWRSRYRHGASHSASSTARAPTPSRNTVIGNHSPIEPLRWTSRSRLRPSNERPISRSENPSVYGWSTISRFTYSVARP